MIALCYLIHGGEPLQTEEIVGEICHQAYKEGYNKRVAFDVNAHFNWDELLNKCQSLDMFAERMLLDIRFTNDTINKQAQQVLEQVLQRQDPNHCIIIRAPKLKASTLNSNWVKLIQKHGKVHIAKPIATNMWTVWLTKRLQKAGFNPTPETLALIAKCYAGNLLAASQFIEKITMALPLGSLTVNQIREFIDNSSQFSIFELSNHIMLQQTEKAIEICKALQRDGTDPILVLWAISRDIRNLLRLKHAITQNKSFADTAKQLGIWQIDIQATRNATERLTSDTLEHLLRLSKQADIMCKGFVTGNVWELLITMCTIISGKRIFNIEELSL